MSLPSLGSLKKVDVRHIWQTEAQHFTPWLAQNLDILAETLDMELEIEAQEKNVGPFRADILCRDTLDKSWVLIENQLERTDHLHLGQLLTYASGLKAVTIIWVSTHFTEEHRSALDWLNNITDDQFKFFGLEVELWQIGDSPVAPKFNIVSKPNDWSRSVGQAARQIETGTLTDIKAAQLEFWTQLAEKLKENSHIRPQKPMPQHWAVFRIGRSGFHMSGLHNTRDKCIGVELYINHQNAKDFYNQLYAQKNDIEAEIGHELIWKELPNKSASRIILYLRDVDPMDRSRWDEYQDWLIKYIEAFDRTFRNRIRNLEASDIGGDDDDLSEPS
ncbi:DUF4268 domain-containing protein [Bartonella sp. W8122]|uniref:DUF4268 domain-containing protein n=1 Tax=Bartonella TaxID=773 RepID=UPI0018DD2354|nr:MULTISPECIES: DUF4268 domain-containing protein [Bartonella]MBI0000849.1 DUF4268 domain-containing protein [Bartonella sp. W8122]MBI0026536.1 DUF4268 domain-containing protein [Bartonella apihabitans]